MIPYNQPDSQSVLNEKAAAAPPSETVRRVVGQIRRAEQVDSADLRRVLGVIRGIEVGPDSTPAWMKEQQK